MSEIAKLLLFFGLGLLAQAVLLVRGSWSWGSFLASLGFSLIGLLPGRNEHNYKFTVHLLFCYAIFAAMIAINFRKALLPRVNEKILLVYTMTLWYALFSFIPAGWPSYLLMAFFAVPTLGTLWLAFTEERLSFNLKLAFYAWYLVMVVLMVLFQFTFSYMLPFFSDSLGGTPGGAVLAGMSFCYMTVNATFIFHMLEFRGKHETKEQAHRNWHDWVDTMTGRYNDRSQLTVAQTFLVTAFFGGLLAANYSHNYVQPATAVNLGILVPLLFITAPEPENEGARAAPSGRN